MVISDSGRLGCASAYSVELLYAPRNVSPAGLWSRANLPNLRQVTWGRALNETSTASVEINTQSLSSDCCELLSQPDYWCFEIRIARDGERVWEGPITRLEYATGRAPMRIVASDVSDWFNAPYGLLNTRTLNYTDRERVEVIAADIVRRQLASLNPPDHPIISAYIQVRGTGRRIRYRRGVVNEYIADTIADLAQYGLDWTTVGRRIVYMPRATTGNRRDVARLSSVDVANPITVTRDGHQLGTVGWGAKTKDDKITRVSYGSSRSLYGRHDRLVELSDADADADDLREAAKSALAGRTTAQVTISLGAATPLRSSAPIEINQLIPGETVLFTVPDLCRPVQARLQIVDVQALWVPGPIGSPGVEKVTAGFTQLGSIDELEEAT